MGMTVLPVFHYVNPSDVRKQRGAFAKPFVEYEKKGNKERVKKWRDALRQVGNLRGWHLNNYRPESHDIQSIAGWISLNLKYDAFPNITKDLVGIDSQVVELLLCLAMMSNNVRFIGIWAMGGMGKTTLARVVYQMVSKEFEACSFIEDVRENYEKDGLVPLQQKIIDQILMETNLKINDEYNGVLNIKNRLCHKKILLVLDDVDKPYLLNMLARKHDWFGSGSRIIITTRDVQVLRTHGVDEIYEVKGLNDEYALQLFCSKAFKKKYVPDDFLNVSNRFLNYAAGLPLALKVLGSFLFDKSVIEWESALERLKEFPEREVLQVLKLSFDGLHETEKEIFLHIACFFNHERKDHVVEILDNLGLYPDIGLKELINKSLLKIVGENILWMHDLLAGMGRNIVHQECPNDPRMRSKLWCYEDIDEVLKKNKGSKAVQAMDIWGMCHEEKEARWDFKVVSKMYNLKFLRVRGILLEPKHLPTNLRILDWIQYPSKSLPSSIQLDELVQLYLPQSKIERLWKRIKNYDKLKIIDLTSSSGLIITPDFTGVPNLEKLVLQNCTNLRELHPSIGILKKLILLNLGGCKKLSHLPSKFEMESLVTLNLFGCSRLKKIPDFVGNMECLQKLFLDFTAIVELPSSVEGLIGLTSLTLSYCKNLVCLPSSICSLESLKYLDLSGCSKFDNLPENLGNAKGLKKLYLRGTAIKEMPSSIEHLISLTLLTLKDCKNLVSLPCTICSLKSLEFFDLSGCSKFENLPENLGNLKGLKKLHLSGIAIRVLPSSIEHLTSLSLLTVRDCKNLVCFPNTIRSLRLGNSLDLVGCTKFENLGNVEGLYKLDLSGTVIKELPSSIEYSTNLNFLILKDCKNLVRLPNTICSLKLLNYLDLSGCSKFDNLPENLGNVEGLELLNLSGTAIKEIPSSIVQLKNLKELHIHRWKGTLFSFDSMLTSHVLEGLLLPSLSGLHSLRYLDLCDCDMLSIPNDIGCLSSLADLNLSGNNFVSLPESSSQLSNLRRLHLEGCKRLQSLENVPSTIECLIANNCTSLERFPKLQNAPFGSYHSELCFQYLNCLKLVDNFQSGCNLLQGQSGRLPDKLEIIIPGSEILEWFNHEIMGHKVNLQVPCGFDELMGIALCVVFERNEPHQYPRDCQLSCLLNVNGCQIKNPEVFKFTEKYGKVESHHLWLLYLSSCYLSCYRDSGSDWNKACSQTDANGFYQLNIEISSWNLKVEKIGFSLLSNKTMSQCINNSGIPFEDLGVLHHDLDNSDCKNKQSLDEDDRAGPSGEGYYHEKLQPKKIQRLGGFMTDSEDSSQREFFNFFAMQGEDQRSKKLESIHGGKQDSCQDIEDPNQTITQLSINSRTLYEDLGDLRHNLCNSATEGSRNKRRHDEEDGAGPSGEAYSNNEPHSKTWRMYG
ncbi:TMV resistance protein N-like isoform X2 [Quercus lobata]|nr:TMV resistance protein N-like isoform X2 [Quercus lobata]